MNPDHRTLQENYVTPNLQCDEGTEFIKTTFKRFCHDNNINLYHVQSNNKASIVESVLRALKHALKNMAIIYR
jgi:hypothetical protein